LGYVVTCNKGLVRLIFRMTGISSISGKGKCVELHLIDAYRFRVIVTP